MDVIGNLRFLNLGSGELRNAIIERLASDPTGSTGRLYYNTTNNEYRFYNGTIWVAIGSTGTVSALQAEVDRIEEAGGYLNADGSFDAAPLNALGNITGLTGSGSPTSGNSTLVDALTQLDTAITAAATGSNRLDELEDVTIGTPAVNQFLVYTDGSPQLVENQTPAQSVTALGLDAGGAADIWVEKAGDTMTGDLTMTEGTQVLADGGSPTVSAPGYSFAGAADTGLYDGTTTSLGDTVDFVGVSVNGSQIARFERGGSPLTSRLFVVDELTVTDGAIITDQNSTAAAPAFTFLGDTDTGMFHDTADEIAFSTAGLERFRIEDDGTLSVLAGSPGYVQLVVGDDDLPNKLYVDNAILAATPALALDDLTDVTIATPALDQFLIYAGSPTIVRNRTPAQSRTSLGLDAGGAGDIWVEKAGDTMTGDLTMNGGDILAQAGSLSNPPISFAADENTGLFRAAEDELDVVVGGTSRLRLENGEIRTSEDVVITAAGEAPKLYFADSAAGSPRTAFITSSTGSDLQFAVGNRGLYVEADGTVSVQAGGSPDYENLVTSDDDIPNKAYVDAQVGAGVSSLDDLTDVTIGTGSPLIPAADQFLIYTGPALMRNRTPAQARTSLGLEAGGAGDIWVEKAGDTMSGALAMGTNKITGLSDGTDPADAVNKSQLDSAQAGLLVKAPCRLATTADLDTIGNGTWVQAGAGVGATLTAGTPGATTIDGVAVTDNDRILVKDQTDATQNGIYKIDNAGAGSPSLTVLTRSDDFDGTPTGEVKVGAFTFIDEGTVNNKTGWTLLDTGFPGSPQSADVDTDELNFAQFQGLPQFTGGTGIDITGSNISVNMGAGITELPSDEVGLDIRSAASSALILTLDGTTRDTSDTGGPSTGSELHLLLDGASLTQGASGLRAASTIVNTDSGTLTGGFIPGDTLRFTGNELQGIDVEIVGSPETINITAKSASTTQQGVAQFSGTEFAVAGSPVGQVSLVAAGVQALIAQPVLVEGGSPGIVLDGNDTLNFVSAVSALGLPAQQLTGSPMIFPIGDPGYGSPIFDFKPNTVVTPNKDVTLTSNGTDTVTVALNAFLGDLQDVGGYDGLGATDPYLGGTDNNLISYAQLYSAYYAGDVSYYSFVGSYQQQYGVPDTLFDRGVRTLAWDGESWTTGPIINGSGVAVNNYDWNTREHRRRYNALTGATSLALRNGRGWREPGPFNGIAVAGSPAGFAGDDTADIFARYDDNNSEWRNFTLKDIMRGINVVDDLEITNISGTGVNQDLWLTIAADSGGPVSANTTTDTLTLSGGTGISTSIAGDAVTITNDSPNVDQNLFSTVSGDTGTATADTTTDDLKVIGGTAITTVASETAGSPQQDGVTINFDGALNDLSDVTEGAAAIGQVIAVIPVGSPSVASGYGNTAIYAESGLRAAATSHAWGHDLNQQWVNVTVLDSSDQVIIPNSITMTDADTVTVTFGSSIECRIIAMGLPTVD